MKGAFTARKSIVIFVSGWTTYTLNVLSTLLVAHHMGPSALGRIGYASGIIGLLVMFTNLGVTFAHTKRIAEGFDPALAIGTCSVLTGALHLLSVPLLLMVVMKGQFLFDSPADRLLFFLLFGAQVMTNLSGIALTTLYAFGLATRVFIGQIAGKAVRLVAIATILLTHRGLVWVALAFFVDSVVTCGLLWASIYSYGFRWPTRASMSSYWRYAKPMVGISSVGMFVDSIDRVILKDMVGLVQLGNYNAARSVLEAAKSIHSSALSILFPKWTKDFSSLPPHELAARFEDSLGKLLLVSGAVSLSIALSAPEIVRVLFGHAFSEAVPVVRILAWGILASGLLGTFHYVLYAKEAHHVILLSGFFTAAVYVAGIFGFTKLGGIQGGAGALYLTLLVPAYWINRRARQTLNISLRLKHMHYVFASFTGFFAGWPLHRAASFYTLIPSLAIGLSVYIFWMLRAGLLSVYQMHYWLDLLNPRKLWLDAAGEFKKKGSAGL